MTRRNPGVDPELGLARIPVFLRLVEDFGLGREGEDPVVVSRLTLDAYTIPSGIPGAYRFNGPNQAV
jgi:hypothetical protein